MRNKKNIIVFAVLLMLAVAVTGCRPAQRPDPVTPQQTTPNQEMTDRNAPMNMQPNEVNQDLNIRADRIVNEVVKINEVRSATVVISERTALVGVNLTDTTKGEINTEIKRQIEEAVRNADPQITRVSVTADPDLFKRIENIARETGRGRPLSGFGREIEELVRRITPGL